MQWWKVSFFQYRAIYQKITIRGKINKTSFYIPLLLLFYHCDLGALSLYGILWTMFLPIFSFEFTSLRTFSLSGDLLPPFLVIFVKLSMKFRSFLNVFAFLHSEIVRSISERKYSHYDDTVWESILFWRNK